MVKSSGPKNDPESSAMKKGFDGYRWRGCHGKETKTRVRVGAGRSGTAVERDSEGAGGGRRSVKVRVTGSQGEAQCEGSAPSFSFRAAESAKKIQHTQL